LEIIQQALAAIDGGLQPTSWPECIPDQRRPRLRRFTELRERLRDFMSCYADLAPAERARVRQAIEDQNEFEDLFSGGRIADVRDQLPGTIGLVAESLFEKAFRMLGALGIRDQNYERFIELVEHRICPFCGCEYFEGVERKMTAEGEETLAGKREPLDHYLALSLYPFAGANARNLIPIGWRCNSSYKQAQDMLRTRTGVRRVCFDPYAAAPAQISLVHTRLFARPDDMPDWHVELIGAPDGVAAWDDVFDIRRRYVDYHLDSVYNGTLKNFGVLCRKYPHIIADGVINGFVHLADLSRSNGLSDRAFLFTAVYDLLIERCRAGGDEADRIIAKYSDARSHAA
jgi:hypothetical protein